MEKSELKLSNEQVKMINSALNHKDIVENGRMNRNFWFFDEQERWRERAKTDSRITIIETDNTFTTIYDWGLNK